LDQYGIPNPTSLAYPDFSPAGEGEPMMHHDAQGSLNASTSSPIATPESRIVMLNLLLEFAA